jgi:hypothetical protein
LTLVLFVGSAVAALVGVGKIFGGGASALALGWGIAAAGFGSVFVIRAIISFVYNDADYVEVWATLAAFMFVLFSLAAFNWFGAIAAFLVVAAWVIEKAGRRQEEAVRRAEVRARREAMLRRKRSDAGPGPTTPMLEESALDLSQRDRQRQANDPFDELPGTRRGAIERARVIDSNPWSLPPERG